MDSQAIKLTRGTVLKVYEWCKKRYRRSKYNGRYPDIVYRKSDYITGEDWGYYDEQENLIFISKDKHSSLADLVDTVIHEYTHYKQNIKVDFRILSKYFESDDQHPLEIEARSTADRDTPICLKEVFGIEPKIEEIVESHIEEKHNIY
jgi:hypothetical protein